MIEYRTLGDLARSGKATFSPCIVGTMDALPARWTDHGSKIEIRASDAPRGIVGGSRPDSQSPIGATDGAVMAGIYFQISSGVENFIFQTF